METAVFQCYFNKTGGCHFGSREGAKMAVEEIYFKCLGCGGELIRTRELVLDDGDCVYPPDTWIDYIRCVGCGFAMSNKRMDDYVQHMNKKHGVNDA